MHHNYSYILNVIKVNIKRLKNLIVSIYQLKFYKNLISVA